MPELKNPWLVAAWPGMGLVGHLAASYLARHLGAEPMAEIPPGDHFDAAGVEVKQGLLLPIQSPRTLFAGWHNPGAGPDLVILLGERQPAIGTRRFCTEVVGVARELGVTRVLTFAAMATPCVPSAPARVFSAATDAALLNELRGIDVELLKDGEIGGLNGVFLAAAAERGVPGACLLGEFPFFASAVPNPKAAVAILEAFGRLSGLKIDLAEIHAQAVEVERQLEEYLKRLESEARAQAQENAPDQPAEEAEAWQQAPRGDEISPEDSERIEGLFRRAQRDRNQAFRLKTELDRLDAFKRYEDRFLDLFRRAE